MATLGIYIYIHKLFNKQKPSLDDYSIEVNDHQFSRGDDIKCLEKNCN